MPFIFVAAAGLNRRQRRRLRRHLKGHRAVAAIMVVVAVARPSTPIGLDTLECLGPVMLTTSPLGTNACVSVEADHRTEAMILLVLFAYIVGNAKGAVTIFTICRLWRRADRKVGLCALELGAL